MEPTSEPANLVSFAIAPTRSFGRIPVALPAPKYSRVMPSDVPRAARFFPEPFEYASLEPISTPQASFLPEE